MTADQRVWDLVNGAEVIGTLRQTGIDMPWFICAFEPGPAWGTVRALFEAQAEAIKAGFPPEGMKHFVEIKDLGLRLIPHEGGEVIHTQLIILCDGRPRFRPGPAPDARPRPAPA